MSRNQEHLAIYQQLMWRLFSPSLALERGQGTQVWDVDGNQYTDLVAGLAVNVLGHAHPKWVAAVSEQAGKLAHVSGMYTTHPQLELAVTLATTFGLPPASRVFLANSGTEANEAALKVALRQGRQRMLALKGGFHGRSQGSLAVTAKARFREGFEAFHGPVDFLDFGDLTSLEMALSQGDVAGLFVEVIQGESGVHPLPPGYLAKARQLTEQHGALLIIDEIQTGMGRTGTWLAHQNPALVGPEPITPDVVTIAKGLAGGFPIGVCLTLTEKASMALGPGDHGTTFGGNPLACAAALATIETIKQEGLVQHAATLGQQWALDLAILPGVTEVRGQGLMIGIELDQPIASAVAVAARQAGFLVNAPGPSTVRLLPPLILSLAEAQGFTGALPEIMATAQATSPMAALAAASGPDKPEEKP
ncbi:MAG: acetylornithine transaminase [Micrococcales bacterium]|nr:acetylornithine transaminase [Micrococcales bacterium]